MGLSQQIGASSLSKPGVCTSTTRPATPYEGQMIYETDTDLTYIYNGTSFYQVSGGTAVGNSGLVFVTSATIGTTVSSVTITGAFSATYDNYKITLSGGTCSGVANFACIFGSTTGAVYSSTRIANSPNSSAPAGSATSLGNEFGFFGQGGPNWVNINCDVFSPFLAKRTLYNGSYMIDLDASSLIGVTQGFLGNNTSYTGFTVTFGAQTVTGATITVYGYRKA